MDIAIEQGFVERHRLSHLCGCDEVGRGCLAGPVVAAAFVATKPLAELPTTINDSKKLSAKKRLALFFALKDFGQMAVAMHDAATIDRLGIRIATLDCLRIAITRLSQKTAIDHVIVDGRDKLDTALPSTAVIRADQTFVSVAAASIVAKVVRDQWMEKAALFFPEWEFPQHKGYGTKYHREMIKEKGPCPNHRLSFHPFKPRE